MQLLKSPASLAKSRNETVKQLTGFIVHIDYVLMVHASKASNDSPAGTSSQVITPDQMITFHQAFGTNFRSSSFEIAAGASKGVRNALSMVNTTVRRFVNRFVSKPQRCKTWYRHRYTCHDMQSQSVLGLRFTPWYQSKEEKHICSPTSTYLARR